MPEISIQNNTEASRFEVEVNQRLAILEYIETENLITFTHTGVPPELEGRGLGSALAHTGLEYARSKGLSIRLLCPFVRSYVDRHLEYESLLPPKKEVR
jgi:uncharacterized protein